MTQAQQLSTNMERNDSLMRVFTDIQLGMKPLAAIRAEQDRLRDLRVELYRQAVKPTTYEGRSSTTVSFKGAVS